MSNERDVYELDTSKGVANLEALYDSNLRLEKIMRDSVPSAMGATEKATGSLTIGSIALGNVLEQLATQAYTALFAAMKNGVVMYSETERAYSQLAVAAGKYTDALAEQADALEKQSGASGESIMAAQAMLLRFGVAPDAIDKTTRAILEYATANRMDLVSATQMVTRAVENGGAKLETLGVEFESTGYAAKDMATAVEALSKKFGGATDAENETLAGRAHQVSVAFEDVQKAWGALVTDFAARTGILEDVKLALEGLRQWAFDWEAAYSNGDSAFSNLKEQELEILEELKDAQTDLQVATQAGDAVMADGARTIIKVETENLKVIREQIAALQHRNALEGGDAAKPLGGNDRRTKSGREDDQKAAEEAKKAAEAAERQRIADDKRINDAVLRNRAAEKKDKEDAERLFKEKEALEEKHLQAIAKLREEDFANKREVWERENAALMKKAEESRKKLEEVMEPWSQMGEKMFGEMAQILTDKLMTLLTTSESVNAKLTEASIKRRQAELKEQGIYRTSEELRAEAAKEAQNADKKRMAEVLATMAIEAGKNAAMEGARAIASAASYDYSGAALHAASAVAFGLLAGGAGAAAYGMSQDRGMTAQERQQLEADNKAAADADKRREKDAKQDDEKAATKDRGTSVNVYYLGITGQTDAEQGRELERIQNEYNGLKTGGG